MEELTQYQDFILKVIELEKEIKKEHKGEEGFNDFEISDILKKYRPENKEITKKIQNLILQYGSDEKSLTPLVQEIKAVKAERRKQKPKLTPKQKNAIKVIEDFMLLYYNKYFRVIAGRVVPTDLMNYDFNSPSEYERKLNRSADASLPIILMRDGDAYFSATCHQDICSWLNANSVNLAGSIRLFISQKNHHFTLSSMYNYEYVDSTRDDQDMLISKNQAEAIKIMFNDAKNRWSKINNLNEAVLYSGIFGGQTKELFTENAHKNLLALEHAFGGEGFSVTGYRYFLKDMATENQFL